VNVPLQPAASRGSAPALRGGASIEQSGWQARLELTLEQRGARTTLVRRRHHGPLGVQRPFHPEPDGTCHLYVLHPPGGLVSGDSLELDATVGAGARALLTTPAATKLYRRGQRGARQLQRFSVAAGARLEWLPQETIAYDGADACLQTRVELEPGAEFLGWELLCLGRPANDERFTRGCVAQRVELWCGAQPLLIERARHEGGSPALDAPWGLGGAPVIGTLVYVGPARTAELLDALRSTLTLVAPDETAVTELASALVCRYRGARVERGLQAFRSAWALLRSHGGGSPAVAPRIWAT
jgi:urease accessory protein